MTARRRTTADVPSLDREEPQTMEGGRDPKLSPLPFSLSFIDGRGRLSLEDVALPPARIDQLDLDIKGLTFPFDLTAGPQRLRDRWLEVERLDLSIGLEELRKALDSIDPTEFGLSDLSLDLDDGAVEVVGRIASNEQKPWFVLRYVPDVVDNGDLLLRPELFVLFGAPVMSFPQLAATITQLPLPCFRAEHFALRTDALPKQLLRRLLVPAGWRMPDVRRLHLETVGVLRRGGLRLTWQRGAHERAATSARALALGEVQALLDPGDEAQCRGDHEEARNHYLRALGREPNHETIVERLAWLDAVNPTRRIAARLGAQRGLEARDAPGLHAIFGSLLIDEGNLEVAAEHFRALTDHLGPLGKARALLLLGQLALEAEPAEATRLLEQALVLDPTLNDALEGLRDGYARLGQAGPLEAAGARLAEATKDPSERAQVFTELGNLWQERFGDLYRATDNFEQALLADPDALDALRGLAECHAARGEYQAGLRCLDAAVRVAARESRLDDEVAAHLRAGKLWTEMGDLTSAAARFHKAARIAPLDAVALEQAADADLALDRFELAVTGYSQLAALSAKGSDGTDVQTWQRAVENLVRVQLDHLDAPGAALAVVERFLAHLPDDEKILALEAETRRRLEALQSSPHLGRMIGRSEIATPPSGVDAPTPAETTPTPHHVLATPAGRETPLDVPAPDLRGPVDTFTLPREFPNPLAQINDDDLDDLDDLDDDAVGALDDEPEGSLEDELDALAEGLDVVDLATPRLSNKRGQGTQITPPKAFARSSSTRPEAPADLFSAISQASRSFTDSSFAIPEPVSTELDVDLDDMIQQHLRSPNNEVLALRVIDGLEDSEDWTRLAAVLAGQIEHFAGVEARRDHYLELLNHLAEVLIGGLDDPQSGAECLLRIADTAPGAEGADHARRAAALLRQIDLDEEAEEAEILAERLRAMNEREDKW